MAKNIQGENAAKLLWRNSRGWQILAQNQVDSKAVVALQVINASSDGGTTFNNWAGFGMLEQTTSTFRIEIPNVSSNSIGRARANSWAVYSSRRWKENIKLITNGLSTIMKLRPSEFDWKKEQGGIHDTSFIAEELVDVIPHAVCRDDDGQCGSIDATRIIPYLVAAIQQQQAQIEALAKQIELLSSNTEGL